MTATAVRCLALAVLTLFAAAPRGSHAGVQEAQGGGDAAAKRGFEIVPGDIPNQGIMFVDRESIERSGHGCNSIVQCGNGDILAFYGNTSFTSKRGHSVIGWTEYRRSTDGGETWGEPVPLEYSKEVFEGREFRSALTGTVVKAPDGTLIAAMIRFDNPNWSRGAPPVYLLSHDHGETWSGPRAFDPDATLEDISITYDASFVHDGKVHIVFIGERPDAEGDAERNRRYSLWVSEDNGESFRQKSVLPFEELSGSLWYSTATVLEDGRIIVYAYQRDDEHNLPYVLSEDGGRTWADIKRARFAKRLRNPQISDKIGDFYFIHGRSGMSGEGSNSFVLYASRDGIHWDEGVFLNDEGRWGVNYSVNEVIGRRDPERPERLLIQSNLAYDQARTNEHHWWIVNIQGTE